jgi:hypothetical protein
MLISHSLAHVYIARPADLGRRAVAGIAVSSPAGSMFVCLLLSAVRCQVNVSATADPSYRGVLPSVYVSLSVIK